MGLWPISRNLHPAIVVLPCSIASVYAGAENRAEIHLQPFQTLCQRQIQCFHRYLLGFGEKVPFLADFLRISSLSITKPR
jgi:hypothetical protein